LRLLGACGSYPQLGDLLFTYQAWIKHGMDQNPDSGFLLIKTKKSYVLLCATFNEIHFTHLKVLAMHQECQELLWAGHSL
jgi:hypothetical protein